MKDFAAAWSKVMNLDRYDLAASREGSRQLEAGSCQSCCPAREQAECNRASHVLRRGWHFFDGDR